MSDEKKDTTTAPSVPAKQLTKKKLIEQQRKDTSWKREPWIGDDGFEYRRQRVQNSDGTFKVFDVRVGQKPIIEPDPKS